jgi:hypothetical protein
MVNVNKAFSICIIAILAISSLIIIKSVSAQVDVTTPSTPNFGVRYEIFPIYVPPVYGVDASTGKAMITKEGYTAFDETVFVEIVNQPFVSYKDSNGNNIQLFYNIRWKEPSNNSWIYLDEKPQLTQTPNSEQTITTFDFIGNYHRISEGLDIPIGSETDFQVEAYIGYYTTDNVFTGKISGWIDPQSIMHAANYSTTTNPNASSTPSQNPTTESHQQNIQSVSLFDLNWEQIAIILLSFTVAILAVVLMLSRRKSTKPSNA